MRVLVDENIPRMTVDSLRLLGHDVKDIRGTSDQPKDRRKFHHRGESANTCPVILGTLCVGSFPLTRLETDEQARARCFSQALQRAHRGPHASAFEARHNRLSGPHLPGQLLLRKAGAVPRVDDGRSQDELLLKGLVRLPVLRLLPPFLVQIRYTRHSYTSIIQSISRGSWPARSRAAASSPSSLRRHARSPRACLRPLHTAPAKSRSGPSAAFPICGLLHASRAARRHAPDLFLNEQRAPRDPRP